MRKASKASLPIFLLLFAGLTLWAAKQFAARYVDENEGLVNARLPIEDPSSPDTLLPKPMTHNAEFAGLAAGYSPESGENLDIITPLTMTDRMMVKKKRGRKGAPPAAAVGNPWTPDVFPMAHLFASPGSEVTPLNVRDPSALVLGPGQ